MRKEVETRDKFVISIVEKGRRRRRCLVLFICFFNPDFEFYTQRESTLSTSSPERPEPLGPARRRQQRTTALAISSGTEAANPARRTPRRQQRPPPASLRRLLRPWLRRLGRRPSPFPGRRCFGLRREPSLARRAGRASRTRGSGPPWPSEKQQAEQQGGRQSRSPSARPRPTQRGPSGSLPGSSRSRRRTPPAELRRSPARLWVRRARATPLEGLIL